MSNNSFAEGNPHLVSIYQVVPDAGHYGWMCPKCGTVLSPYVVWCYRCSRDPQVPEISHSTTSTGGDYTAAQIKVRCDKCAYQLHCPQDKDDEGKCPKYKRDAPDGGFYD